VAAAAAGCTHRGVRAGVYHASDDRYSIAIPGEPWKRVSMKGADLVLAYEERGASILASTLCGRYAEAGLDILSRDLFIDVGRRKIIDQETVELPAGKAARMEIEARLEETSIRAEAYTLKRDPCIYDFVYMSIPDHFEENLPAFRAMMQSLRFGTGEKE
jgi:hypothetical protein